MRCYQSLQLVCANGHVLVESAYDTERATREESEKLLLSFAREKLKPFCMLCGSPDWRVQDKQTTPIDLASLGKRFFEHEFDQLRRLRGKSRQN